MATPVASYSTSQGWLLQVVGNNGKLLDIGDVMTGLASPQGSNGTGSQVVGQAGEVQSSSISTFTNATTTATYQALTSITLTPGVWAISGNVQLSANSATLTTTTNALAAISTTSASAAGTVSGTSLLNISQAGVAGTIITGCTFSPFQAVITVSTTYFLNVQSTFTAGNPQFNGFLYAERVR